MTGSPAILARAEQPPTTTASDTTAQTDANADQLSNQSSAEQACDIQACARNYSSFRASNCTYQPHGESSRRRCDRNTSETTASNGQCYVDACSSTYSSFEASTCTYQPYDGGPRRMCTK
jgi:hypothetical protein